MREINFTRGVPAPESIPVEELKEATLRAIDKHSGMFHYGSASGFEPLLTWIAERYEVTIEQVMASHGSLQILDFLIQALLRPGDEVFTESPTYDRALTLFKKYGIETYGIPMLHDGPDLEVLENKLGEVRPKLFYVIPDFQNPTGVTWSLKKRQAVADLAGRYGTILLEDAPYRMLRYQGSYIPTLRELIPHSTLHMSSFTKLIAPGVRCGFLVGSAPVVGRVCKVAENTYITPGYFAHGVVYEWCRTERYLRGQIDRLQKLYSPRLDACLTALDKYFPGCLVARPEGGFFVSVQLPEGFTNDKLRLAAKDCLLNIADGKAFFPNGGGTRFLRLPFCALSPEVIQEGICRLADVAHRLSS